MKRGIAISIGVLALAAAGYLLFVRHPATSATTPPPVTEQHPAAVAVSTTTVAEESDKYSVHIDYPHFGIFTVDSQIENKVLATLPEFKKEANADNSGQSAKYDLGGTFDSVYVGPDVVSARVIVATYTGGAHPNPAVWGANFDPVTGKELTLDDALSMTGLTLQQISDQSKTQLTAALNAMDGTLQFPEGADPKPENYATFVVDKNNVTFIFQAYQVAAYSAGILETSFPRK